MFISHLHLPVKCWPHFVSHTCGCFVIHSPHTRFPYYLVTAFQQVLVCVCSLHLISLCIFKSLVCRFEYFCLFCLCIDLMFWLNDIEFSVTPPLHFESGLNQYWIQGLISGLALLSLGTFSSTEHKMSELHWVLHMLQLRSLPSLLQMVTAAPADG